MKHSFIGLSCVALLAGGGLCAEPDRQKEISRLRNEVAQHLEQNNERAAERARIKLAELLMEEGKLQEAGIVWDNVTQLYFKRKERPKLFALMGACYEQLHQYEKAIPAYEQAQFWAPNNWHNHLNLARVYRLVDLFQEAIPYYENVLEKKKDSFEAKFGLAQAYARLQYYDKALEYHLAAQPLCPPEQKDVLYKSLSEVYEHLGAYGQALSALAQVTPGAPVLEKMGFLYERQGRLQEAMMAYKQAWKAQPKDAGLLISMAMIEFKRGRLAQAEKLLTDAVSSPEDRALAYYFRALVRKHRGAHQDAAADARSAKALAGSPVVSSYAEKLLASLTGTRARTP